MSPLHSGPGERLWRLRRGDAQIDAVLIDHGGAWELQYRRNDECLLSWRYDTPEPAIADADRRLRELQRAGWYTHW